MYYTINKWSFSDLLRDDNNNDYSVPACDAIYEILEDLHNGIYEVDIVAIRGEFTEYNSLIEVLEAYNYSELEEYIECLEDGPNIIKEEELLQDLMGEDNTIYGYQILRNGAILIQEL